MIYEIIPRVSVYVYSSPFKAIPEVTRSRMAGRCLAAGAVHLSRKTVYQIQIHITGRGVYNTARSPRPNIADWVMPTCDGMLCRIHVIVK